MLSRHQIQVDMWFWQWRGPGSQKDINEGQWWEGVGGKYWLETKEVVAFIQEVHPQGTDKQTWMHFRVKITKIESPVLETGAIWAWGRDKLEGQIPRLHLITIVSTESATAERKRSWGTPYSKGHFSVCPQEKLQVPDGCLKQSKYGVLGKQMDKRIVCYLALSWSKDKYHKALKTLVQWTVCFPPHLHW